MSGRFCDPGMGSNPPRVVLALRSRGWGLAASGVGVSTPCGVVSARATSVFVPGLSELYGGILNAGMGPYPPGRRWLYESQVGS